MKRIRTGRDLACRWSGIMLQSRRSQEIEGRYSLRRLDTGCVGN
uniref:Uncharacterized protein n=1 Tax=Escherichia coli TaxID=562 RepID=A0A7U1E154_ECOLX|nr:hypothetical protein [Escherichia coli]